MTDALNLGHCITLIAAAVMPVYPGGLLAVLLTCVPVMRSCCLHVAYLYGPHVALTVLPTCCLDILPTGCPPVSGLGMPFMHTAWLLLPLDCTRPTHPVGWV